MEPNTNAPVVVIEDEQKKELKDNTRTTTKQQEQHSTTITMQNTDLFFCYYDTFCIISSHRAVYWKVCSVPTTQYSRLAA